MSHPRRAALLGVLALVASTGAASVALAADSGPTPGGHYVGRTSQGLAVNVTVSAKGNEFAAGRLAFELYGGCHARRFFTLSPTPPPAVLIRATGLTTFTGTFPPSHTFLYTSKVTFYGQFTQHGRLLTGSAKYAARSGAVSCTSGLVHFRATRR